MTGRTWQSSRVRVAGKQETEGARNQTTLRSLPLMIYFQLATTPNASLLPQTVPSAGDKHVAHQAVGPAHMSTYTACSCEDGNSRRQSLEGLRTASVWDGSAAAVKFGSFSKG